MKIEHIALWVKDLEAQKNFYTRFFGGRAGEKYTNAKKNYTSYFISFDTGARLELMHIPTIPANQNDLLEQYLGLIHFAMSVGSKEKVDELTETLRSEGYKVLGEARWTGDGYYESVVLDPENNRIEITI